MNKRLVRGPTGVLKWAPPLLLLLCAVLLYAGSRSHTRLPQESELIWDHPAVTGEGSESPLLGRWQAGEARPQVRPFPLLIRRIENALYDFDRTSYQWDQVLLHGLASILVYLFLLRWLRSRSAVLLGALVFTVHPVLGHSVLFLGGMAEILATILFLGTLLAIDRALARPGAQGPSRDRWVVGVLALLAMLTKESAFLLLPVAAPIILWHRPAAQEDPDRKRLMLVLVIAAAIALAWRLGALALTPEPLRRIPAIDPTTGVPLSSLLPKALAGMGFLLASIVAPARLTHEYSWLFTIGGALQILMAAVAVLGTAAVVWTSVRSRNGFVLACALLATLPLLVPAVLPGLMGSLASERSLYLALPGWIGLAAFGVLKLVSGRPGLAPVFAGVGLGIVLLLAVLSGMRQPVFATEEKLLEAGLAAHPRNPQLIFERGNGKLSSEDYPGAAKDYQIAISMRGGAFPLASVNLAATYIAQKDLGMALRILDPVAATAKHVRAMRLVDAKAHYHAGLVLMQQDRQKEAAEAFERMLLFFPDHLGARANLGLIYVRAPHYVDRGMEHLRFAIAREQDPAKRGGLEKGLQRAEGLIQVYIDKYGATPAERDKPEDGVLGVPWEAAAKEGM